MDDIPEMVFTRKVLELIFEAFAEDARRNARLDTASFDAYFAEEPIAAVAEAWCRYSAIRDGDETITDLIKALA